LVEAIKSVAVYCGHENGNNPQFIKDASRLGELLAKNKIRMIFGGGNVGLMGAVATSVLHNGGEVIGITTPNVVARQEPAHEQAIIKIVEGLSKRKQEMFDLSDAFIILPGGTGTLDELTDILTKQQVRETKKPLLFLNTAKFWDIFGKILVHMEQNGFIENIHAYNISVAANPEEIINILTNRNNFISTSEAMQN